MSPRGLALLLLLLVVAESSALRVPTRLVPPPRARPTVCLAGEPDDATLERGRAALEQILENGDLPSRRSHETTDNAVLDEIMDDVDRLSRGHVGSGEDD